MIYLFLLILVIILLIWLIGILKITDFHIPTFPNISLSKIKKILVVFPHPDDEVHSCGGFLHKMSKKAEISYLILTKGERGNEGAKKDNSLKKVREKEAKKAAKFLGISKLFHLDLGDGLLNKKKSLVKKTISEYIKQAEPDLVITYDISGLYGHEDHIAVSEAVTELRPKRLWYISMPDKLYSQIKLPEHMATSSEFRKNRSKPTHKIFTGINMMPRIRALYSYKTQLFAFRKSYPYLPLWFISSMRIFEYFHEQKF